MLPDLRFVIGAVLAVALLGVTAFGVTAAMHIAHQTKLGPLEASRLLAYTNDGERRGNAQRGPFVNIPIAPISVPPPPPVTMDAPVQVAAKAKVESVPAAPAETNAQAATPDLPDTDTVDERAVVDPPLPPDDEPQPITAEQRGSPVPAAEKSAPVEAAPVVIAPVEIAPVVPVPVATTPAAPPAVAAKSAEPPPKPEVVHVGSVTPATDSTVSTVTQPPPATAPIRKQARKAIPKAKRAAPKVVAKARPRAQRQTVVQPNGKTGYPVSTTGETFAPLGLLSTTSRRNERPLWGSGGN